MLKVSACDYDCSVHQTMIDVRGCAAPHPLPFPSLTTTPLSHVLLWVFQPVDVTPSRAYQGYSCQGCPDSECVLTGEVSADSGAHQACCVVDDFMQMGGA